MIQTQGTINSHLGLIPGWADRKVGYSEQVGTQLKWWSNSFGRQNRDCKTQMGPNLLADKSAIQMLSQHELHRLFAHFNLVTCNVLLVEILGDLKKWKDDEVLSTSEV